MVNVNFIGRLGADPEQKVTTSGSNIVTMRVAVDEFQNGQKGTSWMSVVASANDKRIVKMIPYLKKGSGVQVFGSEKVSIYTDRQNMPAIDRAVFADRIEFVSLGSKSESNTQGQVAQNPTEYPTGTFTQPTVAPVQTPSPAAVAAVSSAPTFDEELPF